MHQPNRRTTLTALALPLLTQGWQAVHAQGPAAGATAVRILVGAPAGGSTDTRH